MEKNMVLNLQNTFIVIKENEKNFDVGCRNWTGACN